MAKKHQHVNWLEQHMPAELVDSKLFKFRAKLSPTERVDVDLTGDADLDYIRLEEQLEDCPQQLVFWGTIFSHLKAHCAYIERKIKARRAVLTEEATKLVREDKTVAKLTSEQIKTVVEKDEQLNRLEEAYINLQRDTGKVFYMVQAVQMKAENARSLAGFKKLEISGS